MQLREMEKKFKEDIKNASSREGVEVVRWHYLGRKGLLTEVLRSVKHLAPPLRKKEGSEANALKELMLRALVKKGREFSGDGGGRWREEEWIDVSLPGTATPRGHLHPISRMRREIERIFTSLGFSIVEGPEVETEYYNFEALNIPKGHPSREMHDTFWLQTQINADAHTDQRGPRRRKSSVSVNSPESALLLRTHTSNVQIRFMKTHRPPFRIISVGRCYRYEATDASHDIQFHQVECLMVGKTVSVANLKAIIRIFFQKLFTKDVETRLRPSYFPFVEPGFEVDMTCLVCSGRGCTVCQKTGWLEMMGAGMVHPNVFREVGYLSGAWQGFAFGCGYDRLAMMKYNISDIRQMRAGDLRFLSRL